MGREFLRPCLFMIAGIVGLGDGCNLLQLLRGSCLPPWVLQLCGQAGEGCRGRWLQWHCPQGQGYVDHQEKNPFSCPCGRVPPHPGREASGWNTQDGVDVTRFATCTEHTVLPPWLIIPLICVYVCLNWSIVDFQCCVFFRHIAEGAATCWPWLEPVLEEKFSKGHY